jgi:hypothetical protein
MKWREAGKRLHNEDLHYLYTSPFVIRVIKSRRMKKEKDVVRTVEMRNAHKIFARNNKGRDDTEDLELTLEDSIRMILVK